MKLNYKLLEAEFIDRPNRFLTRVNYNGNIIESHLPDPGRLKELLYKGVKVLIKKESGVNRKTAYSTQAVYYNDVLISLNTLLPNQYVEYLLINKKIDFLKHWELDKKEVTIGKHRFDFQLKNNSKTLILEIKSVSLVKNSIAKFPDSVTLRGYNHIKKLGQIACTSIDTMVIFVVQRPDAKLFQPEWSRDPKFCAALCDSYDKGLEIKVINMKMGKRKIYYMGELPFKLN